MLNVALWVPAPGRGQQKYIGITSYSVLTYWFLFADVQKNTVIITSILAAVLLLLVLIYCVMRLNNSRRNK